MTNPDALADYGPLLDPKPEPSPRIVKTIDGLALGLPALAALLSVAAGWAALHRSDVWAAWFGIIGGVAGAAGVYFTGLGSRVRDARLERAWSLGVVNMDAQERFERMHPTAQF